MPWQSRSRSISETKKALISAAVDTAALDPKRTFGIPLQAAGVHQLLRSRLMQREGPVISGSLLCQVFLGICNNLTG